MGNKCSRIRQYHKDLSEREVEWVKLQPFLLRRGYALRRRYQPGWKPSWQRPWNFRAEEHCEDSLSFFYGTLMDATRISDGKQVVIKMIPTHTQELPIMMYLNNKSLKHDPRNRFVDVLDVLLRPDTDEIALVVMPKLMVFGIIPFQFVDEVIEAFAQFFEVLSFLHEHNIAHMDACFLNMMMDHSRVAVDDFHFAQAPFRAEDITQLIRYKARRDVPPVNYFLIDAGISVMTPPGHCRKFPAGTWGAERNVPEHRPGFGEIDPFCTDVYQMGMVVKRFVKNFEGLSLLSSLADQLTLPDPNSRLTASEACAALRWLQNSLPADELDRRIWYRTCYTSLRRQVEIENQSPPELLTMYVSLSTNMTL